MGKLLAVVFLLLGLAEGAKGDIIDPRRNLQWENNPEYAYVVKLSNGGTCTGQFIAPDLILTANHCLSILEIKASMFNYKGEKFTADVIARGYSQQQKSGYWNNSLGDNGFDWMLLKVNDGRYYSDRYLSVAQGSQPFGIPVSNVGFGSLRKMGDYELAEVRYEYINFLRSIGKGNSYAASTFLLGNYVRDFDDYLKKHTAIPPINNDAARLKVDPDCRIIGGLYGRYGYPFDNNFLNHSCASVGGNSGSALVDSSGRVVGLHARGSRPLGWERSSYDSGQDTSHLSLATKVDLFNSFVPASEAVRSSASREERSESKTYVSEMRSKEEQEPARTIAGCPMPKPYYNRNPSLAVICSKGWWWVKDGTDWIFYDPVPLTWLGYGA